MHSIKAAYVSIAEVVHTFVNVTSTKMKMLLLSPRHPKEQEGKMFVRLTEAELIEDMQTYPGLTKAQAEKAARYVFLNEDKEDIGVITCKTRERWIEIMEIGLDFSGDE